MSDCAMFSSSCDRLRRRSVPKSRPFISSDRGLLIALVCLLGGLSSSQARAQSPYSYQQQAAAEMQRRQQEDYQRQQRQHEDSIRRQSELNRSMQEQQRQQWQRASEQAQEQTRRQNQEWYERQRQADEEHRRLNQATWWNYNDATDDESGQAGSGGGEAVRGVPSPVEAVGNVVGMMTSPLAGLTSRLPQSRMAFLVAGLVLTVAVRVLGMRRMGRLVGRARTFKLNLPRGAASPATLQCLGCGAFQTASAGVGQRVIVCPACEGLLIQADSELKIGPDGTVDLQNRLLSFGCPGCRAILDMQAATAGKKTICPRCKAKITTPIPRTRYAQLSAASTRVDLAGRSYGVARRLVNRLNPLRLDWREASKALLGSLLRKIDPLMVVIVVLVLIAISLASGLGYRALTRLAATQQAMATMDVESRLSDE